MSRVVVEWHGAAMHKRIRGISEAAVMETAEKGASLARSSHPWKSRSGKLHSTIEAFGVEKDKNGITGSFGYGESYGLFLEIGMRGRPGDHTLRRAGDREAGNMAERMKAKY